MRKEMRWKKALTLWLTMLLLMSTPLSALHALANEGMNDAQGERETNTGVLPASSLIIDAVRYEKEWTNQALSVYVDAHGVGQEALYYALDGEELHWQKEPLFTIEENGTYVFLVNDQPQREGSVWLRVQISCIDQTAPQAVWQTYDFAWCETLMLQAEGSDAESGLCDAPYSFDEGKSWQKTPMFFVRENGTYTVWVKDCAGNIGQSSITVSNIDREAPTLKEGEIVRFTQASSILPTEVVHCLGFGSYFSDLRVTVPYEDDASGLQWVKLLDANQRVLAKEEASGKTGEVVLQLPASAYAQSFALPLSLCLRDRAGHEREIVLNKDNTNLRSLQEMVVEAIKPKIDVHTQGEGRVENGVYHHRGELRMTIVLSDEDAGLQSAQVTLNEQRIYAARWLDDQRKEAVISLDEEQLRDKEGENRLLITAVDHAGNVHREYLRFYQDTKAPKIIAVRVNDENVLGEDESRSLFVDDPAWLSIQVLEEDSPPTWVEITMETTDGAMKSKQRIETDAQGMARMALPVSFKGTLTLSASDAMGNRSETVSTVRIITESVTDHEQHAETDLLLPSASAIDAQGLPLYGKAMTAQLHLADAHNGIHALTWTLTSKEGAVCRQGALSFAQTEALKVGDVLEVNGVIWTIKAMEQSMVTEIQGQIVLSKEGNAQRLTLEWSDHGGHSSSESVCFSIDQSAPQLAADHAQGYYKEAFPLVLQVTDANLSETVIEVQLIKDGEVYAPALDWQKAGETWQTTLTITQDGAYEMTVCAEDRAGHTRKIYRTWVLDTYSPQLTLHMDTRLHSGYLNHPATAMLYVKEKFLDLANIRIVTETGSLPIEKGEWTKQGETYRLRLSFTQEGNYRFYVTGEDRAGNTAVLPMQSFTLDASAPALSILGVYDKAHLKGELPVEIRSSDLHPSSQPLHILLRSQQGAYQASVEAKSVSEGVARFSLTRDLLAEAGVYVLEVMAEDAAGNQTLKQVSFTWNPQGSFYSLPYSLYAINHSYVRKIDALSITESNVSPLMQSMLLLTYNGTSRTLQKDSDYTVLQTGESPYSYTYRLSDALFKKEGVYSLRILSLDAAGHHNDSFSSDRGISLTFGVDHTPPHITRLPAAEEDATTVSFSISDNYQLAEVRFFQGEDALEAKQEGDRYTVTLKDGTGNLRVYAVDAAGNRSERVVVCQPQHTFRQASKPHVSLAMIIIFACAACALSLTLLLWQKQHARG